jgi:hypothetical protein
MSAWLSDCCAATERLGVASIFPSPVGLPGFGYGFFSSVNRRSVTTEVAGDELAKVV